MNEASSPIDNAFKTIGIDLRGKSVLNVGDGDACWTPMLKKAGAEVMVADPFVLPEAKMAFAEMSTMFEECRGQELLKKKPELKGTFDVISNMGLSGPAYFNENVKMLPMIVTALKDNGSFVLPVESEFSPEKAQKIFGPYFSDIQITPATRCPKEEGLYAFEATRVIHCRGPIKELKYERIAMGEGAGKFHPRFSRGNNIIGIQ